MKTGKTLLVLVGAAFPCLVSADLLTFRIEGTVSSESTEGRFAVGRPYTMTMTIDTASPKVTLVPEIVQYPNAITSFRFDYDSGAYVAQGQNQGGINVSNNERGLYDHFTVYGLGGFPAVAGQTHSGTYFYLTDTSAVAFASTDLPRTLNAEAFQSRQFQINWGIDWNTRRVSLALESITLVQRRPEIIAWTVATNTLGLEIEFPSLASTNILETSSSPGALSQWETVTAFIATGGKTNWNVPLQLGKPQVFYRMRPQ